MMMTTIHEKKTVCASCRRELVTQALDGESLTCPYCSAHLILDVDRTVENVPEPGPAAEVI